MSFIPPASTGGGAWGDITGTLSNQEDLQSALDGKLASGGALGTPASGTLTNCTGLPAASVLAGTLGAGNFSFSNTGIVGWTGRSTLRSGADGNVMLANAAGSAFGLLQFGGTSSSLPALKANNTDLQCRLADDSGYANFSANGYFAGPDHVTGVTVGPLAVITAINVIGGIVVQLEGS